jgi:hypothetical protein
LFPADGDPVPSCPSPVTSTTVGAVANAGTKGLTESLQPTANRAAARERHGLGAARAWIRVPPSRGTRAACRAARRRQAAHVAPNRRSGSAASRRSLSNRRVLSLCSTAVQATPLCFRPSHQRLVQLRRIAQPILEALTNDRIVRLIGIVDRNASI